VFGVVVLLKNPILIPWSKEGFGRRQEALLVEGDESGGIEVLSKANELSESSAGETTINMNFGWVLD
jgi:hypothetical protein